MFKSRDSSYPPAASHSASGDLASRALKARPGIEAAAIFPEEEGHVLVLAH